MTDLLPDGSSRSARRTWTRVRHAILALGLVISLLQYYLIDVYVHILSLPHINFPPGLTS